METSVISLRGNMGKVKGCAKVNNETVAELEVMFAIVEEEIK
jgi:3-hydroxymyristoyl/3-hydroxydecanoyl-(acyl carrier protein) dehydratase